jgi:carbamoyl-phosphate synthase small subunit
MPKPTPSSAAPASPSSDLDTRALVRHLRTRGVMRGVLSAIETDARKLVEKARGIPTMAGLDLASRVSTPQPTSGPSPWSLLALRRDRPQAEPRYHVVAYDYGIKHNILRRLVQVGCRVTVVPALTSAEDVLALKPDGVFLSNGPGDPEPLVRRSPTSASSSAASPSSASAWATSCSASPWAARPTS